MHRHVQQLLATRVICVCVWERLILLARSRTRIFFFYFSAASRHACDVRVRVCERRASHARACVHHTHADACAIIRACVHVLRGNARDRLSESWIVNAWLNTSQASTLPPVRAADNLLLVVHVIYIICIYICIYVYVCMYIRMYVCMYECHTYIHTYILRPN